MSASSPTRVLSEEHVAAEERATLLAHGAWRWCGEFDAGERAPKLTRAAVAAVCGSRYDSATVVDIQLVVSELVTNCIEHAGADRVRLCLHGSGSETTGEVVVSVTSATSVAGIPEPSEWQLPGSNSRTGRGLAMIRRIGRAAVGTVDAAADPGWSGVTVAIVPRPR